MPRYFIVAALAAAMLSNPAWARQKPARQPTLPQQIAALVKRQSELLMKKDATGLSELFTGDAAYATASGEVVTGRDKIRDYYSKTIPALGDNFTRESATDEIHALGSHAWALGHGRTVVKTQEGTADLKDHWIAFYEAIGGEWKIRALSLGENITLMPAKY